MNWCCVSQTRRRAHSWPASRSSARTREMSIAVLDEDGQMRPLALVSSAPTATNTHFLAVPLAAAVAYLFT